jgi:tetratricopeptide (TPR) repeat protein
MENRKIIPIIMASLLLCVAWMDPFADHVRAGNAKQAEKSYQEAMEQYRIAGKHRAPRKSREILEFNRALAKAGMGDTAGAIEGFTRAASSEDPEIQKKALFNLGNLHQRAGNRKAAAEGYIAALRVDPGYEKARKNLEYLYKKDDEKNDKNQQNPNGQNSSDQQKQDGGQSGQDTQNSPQTQGNQQSAGKLDPKVLEGMLESMKKSPVRRSKGERRNGFFSDNEW